MDTFRYKGDSATRRRFMDARSFEHPGKMHCSLFLECLERYSKPGDTVLDCMAGSGTALLGAVYGRSMVLVELEEHFCIPMRASWKKIQQNGPALGFEMGQAVILRGDARALPLPDASVGAAITSPPYEGSLQGDEPCGKLFETERRVNSPASGNRKSLRKPMGQGYSKLQARADRVAEVQGPGKRNVFQEALDNPQAISRRGYEYGYTRPVDAIVTSPPYAESLSGENTDAARARKYERYLAGEFETQRPDILFSKKNLGTSAMYSGGYTRPVDAIGGNVGNERGPQYWLSMSRIYAECWRVLRPGGIMALVLKGFTRDGKYIDLPGQTEALLLEAGWQKHDEWRRELWSLSFWRILQKRRDPLAFDDRLNFEEVLVFKKPEGQVCNEGVGICSATRSALEPGAVSAYGGKECYAVIERDTSYRGYYLVRPQRQSRPTRIYG